MLEFFSELTEEDRYNIFKSIYTIVTECLEKQIPLQEASIKLLDYSQSLDTEEKRKYCSFSISIIFKILQGEIKE